MRGVTFCKIIFRIRDCVFSAVPDTNYKKCCRVCSGSLSDINCNLGLK